MVVMRKIITLCNDFPFCYAPIFSYFCHNPISTYQDQLTQSLILIFFRLTSSIIQKNSLFMSLVRGWFMAISFWFKIDIPTYSFIYASVNAIWQFMKKLVQFPAVPPRHGAAAATIFFHLWFLRKAGIQDSACHKIVFSWCGFS